MRIQKIQQQSNFAAQNSQNTTFKSVFMTPEMQTYAQKCMKNRSIDPLKWAGAIYAMAKDSSHFRISKTNGGFFGSPKIVVERSTTDNIYRTIIAEAEDVIDKIKEMAPDVVNRMEAAHGMWEDMLMASTKAISNSDRVLPNTSVNKQLSDSMNDSLQAGMLGYDNNTLPRLNRW